VLPDVAGFGRGVTTAPCPAVVDPAFVACEGVDGLPVDGELGFCAAVMEGAAGVAMGGGCTNAGKVIELTTEGSSCSFT
jgi:hypothetical protein